MLRDRILPIAGAMLLALGAKLLLIQAYGSEVPYWDQWDSEAAFLYQPYVNGALTWEHLVAVHNEHRILITRLLGLGLLEAIGVWFPSLQMAVNAALHALAMGLLLLTLARGLGLWERLVLALGAAALMAVPLGWENTLGGFQSQFYLVLGFSALALRLAVPAPAFSKPWLWSAAAGVAAYFSMSSGAFAFLAAAFIGGLQMMVGARVRTPREFAGLAMLTAAFALCVLTVPDVSHHADFHAQSAAQFLYMILAQAAWPLTSQEPQSFVVLIGLAGLANAPLVGLTILCALGRPPRQNAAWLILAVGAWLGAQWLSFAYGRGNLGLASRYYDTLAVGVVANLAALLVLIEALSARRRTRIALVTVYVSAFVAAIAVEDGENALHYAAERSAYYAIQTANVRGFLASDNPGFLEDQPYLHIPYPRAERLIRLLRRPGVVAVLHPDLTGRPPTADLVVPDRVQAVFRGALILYARSGLACLILGGVLIGLSLPRRQPQNASTTLE